MRVLIACEFSGVVRDAFRARGHDAWSCDLLPVEIPQTGLGHIYHIQGDVRRVLGGTIPQGMVANSNWRDTPIFRQWDLMVAHPPCTHLAVSGARWFKEKQTEQIEALQFVRDLMAAPIPRIALENPISIISSRIRKPDQIIQPWQFGHGEVKATCLWLKALPELEPTDIVAGRTPRVHHASPGPDRWKERSRTLPGIAAAMAEQWGGL